MNVLVIEDSEDMRYLMSELLPMSLTIDILHCAANEAEALGSLGDMRPDVVVLDSRTGGPAPEHTAALMRSINADVKIISFSGLAAIEGGWADAIVPKSGGGMRNLASELAKVALELEAG